MTVVLHQKCADNAIRTTRKIIYGVEGLAVIMDENILLHSLAVWPQGVKFVSHKEIFLWYVGLEDQSIFGETPAGFSVL